MSTRWLGLMLGLLVASGHGWAAQSISDSRWQLVSYTVDNRTIAPNHLEKFTLTFQNDGKLAIGTDCNRGFATWQSSGEGQLAFGPVGSTRMACPPDSFSDQFLRDLQSVASYRLNNDRLTLATNAGVYEFLAAVVGESQTQPGH